MWRGELMDLDELEEALTGQDITGTDVAVAVAVALLGVVLYLVIGRLLRRAARRWPKGVVPGEALDIGIRLAQFLVLGVFIAWALTVLGANVGWLTLLIVAVLVMAAVLAKPFIDGLSSSVTVATRAAFSVGDEVEIDGVIGVVDEVATRSTVLRTPDGRTIDIPHTELVDKTVTVFTGQKERRSAIEIAVDLHTDLDEADRVITSALKQVESISRIGPIRARSFSEGVVLSIRFWHGSRLADGSVARDAAIRAIKTALIKAGMELAPAASIRLDQPAARKDIPSD